MKYFFSNFFFLIVGISFAQNAELKKELGRIYSNPDSSRFYLKEAESKLFSKSDSGLYYYFKAESFNLKLENQAAKEAFIYSLDYIDPKLNPELVSLAYIRLTRLDKASGQFEKALQFSQDGLKHTESSLDSNFMGYHLLDIAVIYHDMESYEQGVDYGKRALKVLDSYSKSIPAYKAFALNSIAINFDDWNKPDSALFYHYKVLEDIENLDSMRVIFTFNNIGNTLLKQEKYAEARKWVEIALGLNRKDSYPAYGLATNFTNLANIAFNMGEFANARQLMDSAAYYVQESGSTEKKRDYLYEEYRFHKKKGELTSAMEFLEKYSALKDTIFQEERLRTMSEMEALYDVEQKERELAESRAEVAEHELTVKSRNNLLLLLLIFLMVLLGLGFFIYYRQKNKTRHLQQEAKLQAIYLEQQTQKRLQDQRDSIASDLHDNIGSQLTFIVSSLGNLKFGNLSKEVLSTKIDQISGFTVETVNELRDTIWAMNKESISIEELHSRIQNLFAKARQSCPTIEFEFNLDPHIDTELKLNSIEGVNFYRIVQEAVNNSIKYAKASKIEVDLFLEDEKIKLKVADDGVGISGENPFGNGMNTMKTRAQRIGKEFEIKSSEGQGTEILVS